MKNTVEIGSLKIGDGSFCVIAGPCAVESKEQFQQTAEGVIKRGAHMLRGGLFKLRTSPDSFQGLGTEAFSMAKEIKTQLNTSFVSEVTDPRQIGDMMDVVDMFQVGSRNMHNYSLLKELGSIDKPVLLKRGFSGRIDEWLKAAEYITAGGNKNVVLCERGIRTFETATRNTFDVNAIAYIKQNTDFPVIADPSHAVGIKELIGPISLAAAAVGADGIIIETHINPDKALSDAHQAFNLDEFEALMHKLEKLLPALDRKLA